MSVTWLNAWLAVSPQIQVADIDDLKAKGFRMIINNRPDAEERDQPTSDALKREAIRLGMNYAHIPIVPGQMTDHDIAEFARAISQANGLTLAFCRTGNRSTQLWNRAREIIANPTQS